MEGEEQVKPRDARWHWRRVDELDGVVPTAAAHGDGR